MLTSTMNYIALLLTVTAAFAYINHYFLHLPRNSGLLVIALAFSIGLRLVEHFFPASDLVGSLRYGLARYDFPSLLLDVALGFLLFAGALDADVKALLSRRWTILSLATAGVALSTFLMAAGMWEIFRLVGIDITFAYCLVFGALVSPTDPVTVRSVLRRCWVPERLQAIITGESLFNDAMGILLYSMFLGQATGHGGSDLHLGHMVLEFLRQAAGGLALGLLTGAVAFVAMRGIDEYNIELMISLALVTGTYGLAQTLHVSGPVAVVMAGLLMGSIGRRYAVSATTRDYLQKFWSLTDELLNSLLFLLIGLEFATVTLDRPYLAAAALAIPLSLLVRAASIALPGLPLNLDAPHKFRATVLLTWAGLRGGISVALALSLPPGAAREPLIVACYGIVLFTTIVQGLTLHRVATWLYPER
jgi:CPA1 family monovalent cation:H+ antiporter